jgi:hypothetical protein
MAACVADLKDNDAQAPHVGVNEYGNFASISGDM